MSALAAMSCGDVHKLVHPYLDGEFEEGDRALLEEHLAGCDGCRRLVAFESSFKHGLKARLKRPAAPPALRQRVLSALDRADAAGDGPVPRLWRRAMPVAAVLAAAAAVAVFLGTPARNAADGAPLVEDAIRAHEKNYPIEVSGNEEKVKVFFAGRVPVPVRPPHLGHPGAALVGARHGHLRGRDAAQIVYQVDSSSMTVTIFDAGGLRLDSLPRSRRVGTHHLYTGTARGYNVVLYEDRGVGYVFTSDLDEDRMVDLVSASFSQ